MSFLLSRRAFLAQAGLVSASLLAQRRRPPNIVIMLIDDLGWADLGCQGSKFYETPNIDRVAAEGMRFTDAYAACCVCSPTRASLLTGKYPARLGITDWIPGRKQWPTAKLLTPDFKQELPLEEVTLAEALQPAGYTAASIGKWHLGKEPFYPQHQGFAQNIGGTNAGSPPSYFPPYTLPGVEPKDGEYLTDTLTSYAERFLEANRDRPFLLYFPHYAVHIPLSAKKEMIERFRHKAKPGEPPDNPVYAAMVASMDESVGRIQRKLRDLGLEQETVFLFLSDNGGLRFEGNRPMQITTNHPLRSGKGHLYEGGIRIPLLIKWPGRVKAGSASHTPVSTIDLFPTLLEAAGVSAPAGTRDGLSLMPVLTGGELKRDALYWHYPHYSNQGGVPSGAVRQGQYKLIEFYEDGRRELFDLRADMGERHNLAAKLPEKTSQLAGLLTNWRKRVGAVMPKPNPAYDPAKADQGLVGVEPATPTS